MKRPGLHGNCRPGTKGERAYRMREAGYTWAHICWTLGSKRTNVNTLARQWADARKLVWPVIMDCQK